MALRKNESIEDYLECILMLAEKKPVVRGVDIANEMGTINYEIVCDVGKRVPRVYIKDGKIVGSKDYYDDKYEIEV